MHLSLNCTVLLGFRHKRVEAEEEAFNIPQTVKDTIEVTTSARTITASKITPIKKRKLPISARRALAWSTPIVLKESTVEQEFWLL